MTFKIDFDILTSWHFDIQSYSGLLSLDKLFCSQSGAKIKHAQFSARKSRFYAQNAQKFGGAAKIA